MSALAPRELYSPEAEHAVLGGLMLDNSAFDRIADLVSERDFHLDAHRVVFAVIKDLIGRGQGADVITVSDELILRNQQIKADLPYLATIANSILSAANIRSHAALIRSYASRRALAKAGEQMMDDAGSADLAAIIAAAEKSIVDIAERNSVSKSTAMSDVMRAVVARINHLAANPDTMPGLPTGYTDLDEMTTGLAPGDMVVVAGRPSMGKTSFALSIAKHLAVKEGLPTLIFSLEMSAEDLVRRMTSSHAKIPLQALRYGRLTPAQFDELAAAADVLGASPMILEAHSGITAMQLRAIARRHKKAHGRLGLIVIDYIQLLDGEGAGENRQQVIADISRQLKQLAVELQCPVIALSQLSRKVEERIDKRPIMSDLRESGSIEQDADIILMLYRDEYYNPCSLDAGVAEVAVLKQRNGPIGTIRMAFLKDFAEYGNLAVSANPNASRVSVVVGIKAQRMASAGVPASGLQVSRPSRNAGTAAKNHMASVDVSTAMFGDSKGEENVFN
jgi:replicative DNA helicase